MLLEVFLCRVSFQKLYIRSYYFLFLGQRFPFYRSSECFKNLNLLGTEFFLQTNTSLIFSPYSFERSGIKSRIFYITSLELMEKVQKLASYENQNPSILTKISLESRTESKRNGEPVKSCSDIRHNSGTEI